GARATCVPKIVKSDLYFLRIVCPSIPALSTCLRFLPPLHGSGSLLEDPRNGSFPLGGRVRVVLNLRSGHSRPGGCRRAPARRGPAGASGFRTARDGPTRSNGVQLRFLPRLISG